MWRIKRQRTKPRTIGNRVLYPKFNGTAHPKRYEMRNTYLDSVCSTCKTKQCSCSRRNPILGYRKQLIDCSMNTNNKVGCGFPAHDISGNVYKDNHAVSCATDPSICYVNIIKSIQNKGGCINESYNYSTNQYLVRRCATFAQQEFNFLSNKATNDEKTQFKSCANCGSSINYCASDCSAACITINKTPCEWKTSKCYATYKRSNPKFNHQGAVSGGARMNRLKYQTKLISQSRIVNGKTNTINRTLPASLYRVGKPPIFNNIGHCKCL